MLKTPIYISIDKLVILMIGNNVHSHLNALVPDSPQVNLIPVYSRTNDSLANLMIKVRSEVVSVCCYIVGDFRGDG